MSKKSLVCLFLLQNGQHSELGGRGSAPSEDRKLEKHDNSYAAFQTTPNSKMFGLQLKRSIMVCQLQSEFILINAGHINMTLWKSHSDITQQWRDHLVTLSFQEYTWHKIKCKMAAVTSHYLFLQCFIYSVHMQGGCTAEGVH